LKNLDLDFVKDVRLLTMWELCFHADDNAMRWVAANFEKRGDAIGQSAWSNSQPLSNISLAQSSTPVPAKSLVRRLLQIHPTDRNAKVEQWNIEKNIVWSISACLSLTGWDVEFAFHDSISP
jgi:hypothetical protein